MNPIHGVRGVRVILAAGALPPRSPLAYFDPNVGGQLFQILAVMFGVLTGLLLLLSAQIRMLFARFKRLVRNLFDRDAEERPNTQENP